MSSSFECVLRKKQDTKAKGGSWSNKREKEQDQTVVNGHWKDDSLGIQRESLELPKEVFEGGGQGKRYQGKGGTYWCDGVSPQGGSQDGGA